MKKDKVVASFIMSTCLLSLTVFTVSTPVFAEYTMDQDAEVILWNDYIKSYANDAFGYINRGNISYSAGDYAKAINDYNAALNVDKYNVEAYVKRGNAKFMTNDLQGALKDYAVALEINPSLPDAKFNTGRIYYKTQDYKKAAEYMREGLKLAPARADYNFELAQAEYKAGLYDLAYSDFSQAIALKSDYADAYYGKGLAAINLAKYQDAVTSFDNVAMFNANYPNLNYYRGVALYQMGKYGSAVSEFDKAIALAPNDGLLYNLRGKAKELAGDKKEAQKDYKKAKALGVTSVGMTNEEKNVKTDKKAQPFTNERPSTLAQREAQKAIEQDTAMLSTELPEAIGEEPSGIIEVVPLKNREVEILDSEICKRLASESIAKGDLYTAVALYDSVIAGEPQVSDNYLERAKLKLDLKDNTGAMKDAEAAIKSGNASAESYYVQGKAYETKGNMVGAYRSYAMSYKMSPEKPETVIALANAAYEVGRYSECEALLTSLGDSDAITFPEMYLTRAKARYQMTDFYSSIADLNRYLKYNKKSAEAYFIRAMDKKTIGNLDDAVEDFGKAIHYDSNNLLYRKYRAQTNLERNDIRAALVDYRKIVVIKGKDATMDDELTVAQLEDKIGNTEQAIVNYTAMLQKDPLNANLFLARARVYNTRDEKINAINDYITTLNLDPSKYEVYGERGILYVDIRSYRKGIDDLTNAIKYDPNNGTLYKYRAVAKKAIGKIEEAERDFGIARRFEAL